MPSYLELCVAVPYARYPHHPNPRSFLAMPPARPFTPACLPTATPTSSHLHPCLHPTPTPTPTPTTTTTTSHHLSPCRRPPAAHLVSRQQLLDALPGAQQRHQAAGTRLALVRGLCGVGRCGEVRRGKVWGVCVCVEAVGLFPPFPVWYEGCRTRHVSQTMR